MSHIPSKAMPHAGPAAQPEKERGGISKQAGKLADKARDNPKAAIAAGAAVVAGAIAAAAIPLVRSSRRKSGGGGSGESE